jgi:hypothetical protein
VCTMGRDTDCLTVLYAHHIGANRLSVGIVVLVYDEPHGEHGQLCIGMMEQI